MNIHFKVFDEDGGYYGTFSTLEDAEEHAQDTANEFDKDVFVEKHTIENIKCFIPS